MMDRILDPSSLLTKGVAKETYLLTQFRVMVTYLRLLLIPVNQNLDYDYPLFSNLLTPEVLASLLLHLALLGMAVTLFLKSKSDPARLAGDLLRNPLVLRHTVCGIEYYSSQNDYL